MALEEVSNSADFATLEQEVLARWQRERTFDNRSRGVKALRATCSTTVRRSRRACRTTVTC
jgi:hypothetical protein